MRKYGWKPQLPDKRDIPFSIPDFDLPTSVDLRASFPPVVDQGQIGSCTGNMWAGIFGYNQTHQGWTHFGPFSRLFIYWNERFIEGTTDQDAGATIRDGVKSLAKWGVCQETDWPYDISQFIAKPPTQAYIDAAKFKAVMYRAVKQDAKEMKKALAMGYPIGVGISVYQSFEETGPDGIVKIPDPSEQLLGGHAVAVVGYKQIDDKPHWIMRNSWGEGWGDKGYFYLPEEYLTDPNLSSDFWVVTWESENS